MPLSSHNKDCLTLLATLYGHSQLQQVQLSLVPVETEDRSRLALLY